MFSDVMEAMTATSDNIWGKLGVVVDWVADAVLEFGCDHREDVLAVADKAIDYIVSLDIPQIPPVVEIYIDSKLEKAAKSWIRDQLDKLCAQ
jgi:hypothetical protein